MRVVVSPDMLKQFNLKKLLHLVNLVKIIVQSWDLYCKKDEK